MNSTYQELLVKRKLQPVDILKKASAFTLTFLCLFASFFINPWFLVASALCIFLDIIFLPKLNIEYEYALVDKEFRIDAIYGKKKRKKKETLDLGNVVTFAKSDSSELNSYNNIKVLDYSSWDGKSDTYSMIIPINNTNAMIIFEPDEAMVEKFKRILGMRFHG